MEAVVTKTLLYFRRTFIPDHYLTDVKKIVLNAPQVRQSGTIKVNRSHFLHMYIVPTRATAFSDFPKTRSPTNVAIKAKSVSILVARRRCERKVLRTQDAHCL